MKGLQKQALSLPFGMGLNTKTDPKQLQPGQMYQLSNAIFGSQGLLQKRNGFAKLNSLDDLTVNTVTTFNGGLTAIGESLYGYVPENNTWYNKGVTQPIQTSVQSVVRNSTSPTKQDTAVSSEGLACAVWYNHNDLKLQYQIIDTNNNQVLVPTTDIIFSTGFSPRVFVLGRYFIITFIDGTSMKYLAIPLIEPTNPGAIQTFASGLKTGAVYGGIVANNNLYLSYTTSSDTVLAKMDSTLLIYTPAQVTTSFSSVTSISVAADLTGSLPVIWVSVLDSPNISAAAFNSSTLDVILSITTVGSVTDALRLASTASDQVLSVFVEASNVYTDATATPTTDRTDYVGVGFMTQAGVATAPVVLLRSVGLASQGFSVGSKDFVAVAYEGSLQPTLFLIDSEGNILAKLAYSNSGYLYSLAIGSGGMMPPSATVVGTKVMLSYLYKSTLTPVNKSQGVANAAGIYAQNGINLVTWDLNTEPMRPAEIGQNLNLSGGFLWAYDGVAPVEQGFHIFPENIYLNASGSGSITDQQYYYAVTYEWTDAQGNIHRSAPSIPTGIVPGSSVSAITVRVPTLRLTAKIANSVRIVIYRWSAAQQVYYQVTSITNPILNDTTVDQINFSDTNTDADIIGNQIIYTAGGVVENIAAPASVDLTLFKSRLMLIDAENTNKIWYSKQVISNTPVEMSDLFTFFVAPTTGAQGSTGPCTALSTMDDKLIIFKRDAAYYITGTGPDNTGANNDFSEPVYISSAVGCTNPKSIVLTPNGLMFQSDKGIWLLGRDLSTNYIGAPVERYNDAEVLSALVIPGTNQVRFTLDNGLTLMYDYYYQQWGVFSNIPAISSTLYEGLHTYVNSLGALFQETPNLYLDGSSPVLMSFTTAWFNLAGLQGLERAYFFYLLGTYLSPHKLSIGIAYDYNPAIAQQVLAEPDNYTPLYGDAEGPYGSESPYGGVDSVEQFRIFLDKQKVQAFQVTLNEVYDPTFGVTAGAGFNMSGLNLVVGMKKGYTTLRASKSVG